jgi:hypothetical protein
MLRPVFLSMPALLAASGSGSGEGGSEAAVAEAVENALRPPSVVDDDEEEEDGGGGDGSEAAAAASNKVVLFVDGIDGVATPPAIVHALLRAIDRRGGGGEQGVVAAAVAAVAAEYGGDDAEETGGDDMAAAAVAPAMAAVLGRCHARHGLPWLREWKGEILPTLAAVLEGMEMGDSGALAGAPALAAKLREKKGGAKRRNMSLRGLEGAARLFAARSLVRAQRRGGKVDDEKAALGLLQECVESAWL